MKFSTDIALLALLKMRLFCPFDFACIFYSFVCFVLFSTTLTTIDCENEIPNFN